MQLIAGNDTIMQHVGIDGIFSFQFATPTQIQLTTSHIGYETDVLDMHVSNDTALTIVLRFSGIELGEMVVTARSTALIGHSGFGAISLSTERMSNLPSMTGTPDINRILQLMPGVQHAGEANGHLHVRGADPGHTLMLYNTVPIYGTSHLLGIFPFINVDHLDRVIFDKAGRNAQFGNRLGATVQTVSPNEIPDEFSVRGNVGLIASQLTVSSPLGDNVGLVVSGRQTYVDWLIAPLVSSGGDDNTLENFGYSFNDANLTLMFRPNERHSVDLNAFVSGDRFTVGDEFMLLDARMLWGNQLASLGWTYQPRQGVRISSDVYVSRFANFLEITQAGLDLSIASEVLDVGANVEAEFELFSMPFVAGFQYANYRVNPQELASKTLPVPFENNAVSSQFFSTYLRAKPALNENFSLDAGLRLGVYHINNSNARADVQLEPRIGLLFSDNNRWTAYVSYARKSQRLHLISTSSIGFPTDFWVASSEGVPVSLANNFSIGSNFRILPNLELSVGGFYSRMSNLLHYPLNILQFNEKTTFGNDVYVGRGRAHGAEFMLSRTGRLSGWISYTLSRSDRQFSEINDGQRFPSKFDRRHNLSAVAIYRINDRWTASVVQIFTSGSRFTTPTSWYFINNNPVKEYGKHNNSTMPSYIRTDVSVDFRINRTRRGGENILNFSVYNVFAVRNPIYVMLDVRPSETGNTVQVVPRYRTIYTILPSISWRFRF